MDGVVHPLPVRDGAGVALHPQRPNLSVRHLLAVAIAQLHLKARHHMSERAGHDMARTIRDEDVPHLGRAESVEELDAENLLPPGIELRGQRFAS